VNLKTPVAAASALLARLNNRERRLVTALAAMLIASLAWVGVIEPLSLHRQKLDRRISRLSANLGPMLELEKKLKGTDRAIVGFFHSHPDVPARPSTYDQDHAWPWYSYLIVSVIKGEAHEVLNWKLKDDRSAFDPEDIEFH